MASPPSSLRGNVGQRFQNHGLSTPLDRCYCRCDHWYSCRLVLLQAILPGKCFTPACTAYVLVRPPWKSCTLTSSHWVIPKRTNRTPPESLRMTKFPCTRLPPPKQSLLHKGHLAHIKHTLAPMSPAHHRMSRTPRFYPLIHQHQSLRR